MLDALQTHFTDEQFLRVMVGATLGPFVYIPYHRARQYFISRNLPTNWKPGRVLQKLRQ